MSDDFYRAFEEVHRGERELIRNRLKVYLPFVEPLLLFYPAAPAIDLGCGRGEWLETLRAIGFRPTGVDIDEGMLSACHEAGLDVIHDDAFAVLTALPDESQAVVSAFHVVEHIGFDQQQLLVSNAIRVLKPGGLLIMETPNPENIMVGTARFYLDPTHLRPIPPSSLSFLAKFHKFHRVKTLRLQESQNLRERDDVGLLDVLEGVSPDYAIVAQKQGETEIMTALDAAFDRDYGLSLESLTSRYDMRINAHITQAESRAQQAESRAQQAESRAQQAENRAQQAENRAQQAEIQVRQASHEASAYRQQAESAQARVEALYSSTSWRITRPLRGIKRALGGDIRPVHEFFAKTTLKIKTIVRPLVARAIRFVFGHPALRAPLSRAIKKWPWLHRRLRRVAANTGAVPEFAFCRVPVPGHIANDAGSETLSPHARRIFMKLKKAVAQRQRGAN